MKFVCPSCKAKYQIADEKVAGRSVKMKCRKCGHVIHVSETITDAPASDAAPAALQPEPSPPPPAVVPSPAPAPVVAKAPPPAKAAPAPAAAPVRAAPAAPARPSAAGAARLAPAAPQRTAAPVRSAPAAAPPRRSPAPATAAALNYQEDDEATRISHEGARGLLDDAPPSSAPPSALAGAFTASMEAAPVTSELATPADDWHVGINGVPVGPLKLAELRAKAAAGAVTPASLVWREGMEDWLPLRTYPELLAIVEESVSSVRASLTPMLAPVVAGADSPVTTGQVVTVDTPDESVVPAPRRGGSLAPWIAVVVALMFGLTIGFVVFKSEPKEIVKYVETPGSKDDPATPGASSAAAAHDVVDPAAPLDSAGVAKGGVRVAGPLPKASAEAKPGEPPRNTALDPLGGLGSLSGPSAPGDTRAPTGGGTGLDSDAVQRTVSRYKTSVQRSCWQPALDTRDRDAPSSARVSVSITVGPSGSVQSASTSGDPKGYRGLASCIASRVRGWQFPASGGNTTVNVPFVFAAQ